MMKKWRIIVVLFILTFSFSVKADVFMEIDCDSKNITSDKSVSCSGNLIYERISIDDIKLEYTTNLDIEFLSTPGFSISKNGNEIAIHSDTSLYSKIMNSTVIVNFKLKVKDGLQDTENLIFKNIIVNNDSSKSVDSVKETFNVESPKKLDNNCFLNSLSVDTVNVKDFNKEKLEYSGITINDNVVFIDAERGNDKQTVTGLGQVSLKIGETLERDINVKAEDGTECIYKLFITNKNTTNIIEDVPINQNVEVIEPKETADEQVVLEKEDKKLSEDNKLKSLELFNGKEKISFKFNSNKNNYDIIIQDTLVEKITIKATLNDTLASFINNFGPREVKINNGNNKILIKVKAQNGNENIYTLNINKQEEKSNDATLSSLKINDNDIILSADIYKYEVYVKEDILKTKTIATASNEKAKINYKEIELVDGDNNFVIEVVADNGDKKKYEINVIRSDKDKLESIVVENYQLDFSTLQKEYTLKIDNDTKELKITVVPENIEYKVINNQELQNGSIVKVKVNDINGESIYRISIVKEKKESNLIYYIILVLCIILLSITILLIRKKKKKDDIEVI